MKAFSYFCSTRIEMGSGKTKELPALLQSRGIGKSVFLVSDPGVIRAGLVGPIQSALAEAGFSVTLFDALSQNPRDIECLEGAALFREAAAEVVVAVGGGSAMDTGKTIALCGPNGGAPADYADGRLPYTNIAPIVCIPTTAGTGSEVTRSAVITESTTHRKMTLKHAALRPTLAVLDPVLTYSVPPAVTAATGVDALVHAIEGYTCKVTNPISQAFGAKAMQTIVRALPAAYANGQDEEARHAMLEGSLMAGLCFGSADVAAVHCLAEALGGLYDTPHGVANSVFLPYVLKFNAADNKPMHAALARYMGFASDADTEDQAIDKLIGGITELTQSLQIPRLKDLPGVREEDFPRIVELSMKNGSTPSNVRTITAEDYLAILQEAYRA
ncbi:iron-containing alcohol dehydrogenase [Brevibacillus centrosporus]|uniref:iron-containing alcohol dehydrogenase n=1 Tax=Brevibacillus centrosporus TaxID=54910 RepID=UPI000F0A0504|nr:iron-containing alcohol dehydrogenase [Brevibacillus centrosporus]MEC2128017.1 iron-containing alcohol dehydrogenase [Brevibacillus centrosporus]MED4910678.1 iron-containing alcohol dehydrogenase [Brevibacillus centrosporus]RNB67612.1 iron-containing alcohol dehydrogenase [Brevibacillus centrosporus]GED30974.1 1,3-propanediol dehydrogenase [Brevibacillus centrosporus]